jgi:plastocyanin
MQCPLEATVRIPRLALAGLLLAGLASSPALAYEVVAVENGAVIEGRVTYTGAIPTRRIVVTKDREVCGEVRDWQQAEVGADNGLKNAVVHLQEVERGKAWPEDARLQTPILDNKSCMFDPHVQVIPPGQLEIHNSDPVLHNVKAYYGRRAAFNLALPDAGMTVSRELPRPGVVRFECDAHGWMEAWIYVLAHPYFAITGENGEFRIEDVPPGDYVLVARQEYIGELEQPVQAEAGKTVDLTLELKK